MDLPKYQSSDQFFRGMTKKARLGISILLMALAGIVFCFFWPHHRINENSFALIKSGMSQRDVENVFGCPPGDYSSGGDYIPASQFERVSSKCKVWIGNELAVEVFFDKSDRVIKTFSSTVFFWNDSFFDKLKKWLI